MKDYNKQTQEIEKIEITDNLLLSVSVTFDETEVYLNVNYLDGKYTIQRSFTNNYVGLDQLEAAKKEFNSEEAVQAYFRL